ncbi:hypothetical protein [Kitasatospora azatica]|uniref:hypothetical protein n=1 Tax=Kitasatospora azatica TaxID=58347 RepID=UPI000566F08C|nr:hypothetical protein [Kitasatospora azatica]
MTTTQFDPVRDVRDLLFGQDGGSPTDAITQSIHGNGTVDSWIGNLRGLPHGADRAIEHEVARTVDGFLGLDLIDLAAGGWAASGRLRTAARASREAPGRTEIVPMLTHRITSSHQPRVDVLVDGHRIGTLKIGLTVVFDIEGLLASVRDARLVGVQAVRCKASGALAVEELVAAQRSCELDLPGALRLRDGIPLLREEQPPPTAPPPPQNGR